MLGLADIVIPGIFVALALRFDVSRGTKIRYFNSAFLGYTVGLTVTIVVMNWFQAAQPALLYIVPGVIGFVAVHCLWNGEVKPVSLLTFAMIFPSVFYLGLYFSSIQNIVMECIPVAGLFSLVFWIMWAESNLSQNSL